MYRLYSMLDTKQSFEVGLVIDIAEIWHSQAGKFLFPVTVILFGVLKFRS